MPKRTGNMTVTDTDENRTQYADPMQDRGWAWVIAFAGMVALCLGFGVYRTLGLLLVELMDVYDTTTTEVSLILTGTGIGLFVTALALMFGLGDIFHERALLVVAGLIASLGFTVTYFSTKVEEVFVLGICTGAAMQIGQACSGSMAGKYFKKRLALGLGIVFSGTSLGTLALPPLVRWLFDQYTYRGAALIMAGISLNSLVSAALMRPFKTPTKERQTTLSRDLESCEMENVQNSIPKILTGANDHLNAGFDAPTGTHVSIADTETQEYRFQTEVHQSQELPQWDSLRNVNPPSSEVRQTQSLQEHKLCGTEVVLTTSLKTEGSQQVKVQRALDSKVEAKNPQFRAIFTKKDDSIHLKISRLNSQNEPQQTRESCCKSIGIALRDFVIRPTKYRPKQDSVWKSLSLSFRFFNDPSFVFLQLFIYFVTVGCECLIQFYPAFTKEVGLSDYQSAFLLSIVGGADLAGRIFYGVIGDCCFLKRYNLLMFPIGIVVIACFLSQFASVFWSQVIFAVAIGFNYGASYSFRVVLIVDLFGRTALLRRIGVTNIVGGLAHASSGPLLGSIRDSTGDFKLPLQMVGVILICSGLCLLSITVHQRCQTRIQQQRG